MYSTGMQLRLGFAIASHLEPDVFVVDEALAVGDAAFQAKCVERMTKLVAERRTVLFVSHSLGAVRQVCSHGMLVVGGRANIAGRIDEVLSEYMRYVRRPISVAAGGGDIVQVVGFSVRSPGSAGTVATGKSLTCEFQLLAARRIDDYVPGIGITDGRPGNLVLATVGRAHNPIHLSPGPNRLTCEFQQFPLLPGIYHVWFGATAMETAQVYTTACMLGPILVSDAPPGAADVVDHSGSGAYGPVYVPFEFRCEQDAAILAPIGQSPDI